MKSRRYIAESWKVRALAAGALTQIRVPVEPEPHPSTESLEYRASSGVAYGCGPGPYLNVLDLVEGYRCPLGKPGDEVWFAESAEYYLEGDISKPPGYLVTYNDGASIKYLLTESQFGRMLRADNLQRSFRSGATMPRWAARRILPVKRVRVEQLGEMTEADARACGIEWVEQEAGFDGWRAGAVPPYCPTVVDAYHDAWDSRYAKRGLGWDPKRWVWVINF